MERNAALRALGLAEEDLQGPRSSRRIEAAFAAIQARVVERLAEPATPQEHAQIEELKADALAAREFLLDSADLTGRGVIAGERPARRVRGDEALFHNDERPLADREELLRQFTRGPGAPQGARGRKRWLLLGLAAVAVALAFAGSSDTAKTWWRRITRDPEMARMAEEVRDQLHAVRDEWDALLKDGRATDRADLARARELEESGNSSFAAAWDDPARIAFREATAIYERAVEKIRNDEAAQEARVLASLDPARSVLEGLIERRQALRLVLDGPEGIEKELARTVDGSLLSQAQVDELSAGVSEARALLASRRYSDAIGGAAAAVTRLHAARDRLAALDNASKFRKRAHDHRAAAEAFLASVARPPTRRVLEGRKLLADGDTAFAAGDFPAAERNYRTAESQLAGALLSVPDRFARVQHAMDLATEGDVIRLLPGVHEGLVIFKSGVSLIGSPGGGAILRPRDSDGVAVFARNVTSSLIAGVRVEEDMAADLRKHTSGLVVLQDSSLTLSNVEVRRSAGHGILVTGAGASVIEECDVSSALGAGIYVFQPETAPVLRRNRCWGNRESGIYFGKGAAGVAEENSCEDNEGNGIAVGHDGSRPVLRKNRCLRNRAGGILFAKGAGGEAVENVCEENQPVGIGVTDQGTHPALKTNICRRNLKGGIAYTAGARGIADGNTCEENFGPGISITASGTTPEVRGNICRANRTSGIAVLQGGGGLLHGNRCEENQLHGIHVEGDGTTPSLIENILRSNQVNGIVYFFGAGGVAEKNFADLNRGSGLIARGRGTTPHLKENRVERNGRWGFEILDGANVKLDESNRSQGNTMGDVSRE